MKGSASLLVKRWLFANISALPVVQASPVLGQVHAWPVPEFFTYPFVTYQRENANEFGPMSGPATSATFRYMVKVVDNRPNTNRFEPIYDAINIVLDGGEGDFPDGHFLTCSRNGELPGDLPPEEEHFYSQLGGLYEFFVGQG